jgi:ABC-type transport system involved in cytochrome bd biosynthesis fused ATPase/permease subunit
MLLVVSAAAVAAIAADGNLAMPSRVLKQPINVHSVRSKLMLAMLSSLSILLLLLMMMLTLLMMPMMMYVQAKMFGQATLEWNQTLQSAVRPALQRRATRSTQRG